MFIKPNDVFCIECKYFEDNNSKNLHYCHSRHLEKCLASTIPVKTYKTIIKTEAYPYIKNAKNNCKDFERKDSTYES